MEKTLVVLLLLCSLSGALCWDNKTEQRKVRRKSVSLPKQPQPCLSDIHAVLRDMSAKLAVLQVKMETLNQLQDKVETLNQLQDKVETLNQLQDKVETLNQLQDKVETLNQLQDKVETLTQLEDKIEQLQTFNKEQASKLKEQENQTRQMDSRQQEQAAKLKEIENQVDTQHQEQAAKLKDIENQVDTQHQEQAAKLKNIENQVDTQHQAQTAALDKIKTRTNVTEDHVESLRRDRAEQAAKLKEIENQVDTQQQDQATKLKEIKNHVDTQHQGQAAELNRLKARTDVTESQVNSLRRDKTAGQVAFSASLLVSGRGHFGPPKINTPLVFKHVISNIGNAYNSKTGIFTAPVRGAYHFEIHIHGYPGRANPTAASLVKNGQLIVSAYELQTNGPVNPSNGVTLLLEPGDTVFVRQWSNSKIYDDSGRHTTFSGHLLFLM